MISMALKCNILKLCILYVLIATNVISLPCSAEVDLDGSEKKEPELKQTI